MDRRLLVRLAVVAHGFTGGFVAAHGSLHELIAKEDERVAAKPDDAELLLGRAHLLRLHGEFGRARADLEKVKALAPELAGRILVEARVYADQGEGKLAKQAFDEYLALVPEDVDAIAIRSRVHEELGDAEASAADARKVIALRNPPLLGDHLRLIQLLAKTGRAVEIRAAFASARVSHGPVPTLLSSEAGWLAGAGERDAAAGIYAEMRRRMPSLAFPLHVEEARMWAGHDEGKASDARVAAGKEWESLPAKMRSRPALMAKHKELQAMAD